MKSKKCNYSENELYLVNKVLGNYFLVSVNKSGNIKLVNPYSKSMYEYFVLYKMNNGYVWRRHNGHQSWDGHEHGHYCYPLNMKNRKSAKPVYYSFGVYYPYYYGNHAAFDTVAEAVLYFKNYAKQNLGMHFCDF